jgi:uncharacterized membrane-anchored protein YjiN (DUF445 family)
MRTIATGLLVLMAVVFVAASIGQRQWAWLGYVRAFAEAGMVGAVADWFAVTALFRHPLGLKIPHTGIIPRNKDRIGAALGAFIADNFLTERVLEEKLRQLEVARFGGEWLRKRENARGLARRLAAVLPGLISSMPAGSVGSLAGSAAMAAARATPAAPLANKALGVLWSDGRAQPLIERVLDLLGGYLATHEEQIQEKVAEQSWKWMPKFVDRMLASKVTSGAAKLLEEMRDPAHPWREELAAWVENFRERLATDPDLQAKAEAFKLKLLADPRLSAGAGELWTSIADRFAQEFAGDRADLAERLEQATSSLGEWLATDEVAQTRLNEWSRLLVRRVIAPRRHELGAMVAQIVASWDTRSIVEKLELQVGKDLQYIRINGALIGGLVGLAIYTTAQLLGLD